jgi:hypothetical protein
VRLAEDDLGIAGDYEAAQIRLLAPDTDGHLLLAWGFVTDGIDDRSVSVGDTTLTDPGYGGAFLTKYTPEGGLLWVRQLRSYGNEFVYDIQLGNDGSVFVAGSFDALELHFEDVVLRKTDLQADEEDGFVARYSADGRLLWTMHAAGRGTDRVNAIDLDVDGNLYVTGEFRDELRLGTDSLTAKGGVDMFVAKFDAEAITLAEQSAPSLQVRMSANVYPNPFTEQTTIRYDLPTASRVRLVVYDVLGREVAVPVDRWHGPGRHEVRFDAGELSSGLYTYMIQTEHRQHTRTMLLVR